MKYVMLLFIINFRKFTNYINFTNSYENLPRQRRNHKNRP